MDTWLVACISTPKERKIYQVNKILIKYFNIKLDFVYIYMLTKTIQCGGRNCLYKKFSTETVAMVRRYSFSRM